MRSRYILEDYPQRIGQLAHTAEAIERLVSRLYDVTVSLGDGRSGPDSDRVLSMIGEYEEMRQRCLNDILDAADAFDRAREAIGRLPPGKAALLTARYLNGEGLAEIAEGLGVSRATAYRRLDEALEELDGMLGPRDAGGEEADGQQRGPRLVDEPTRNSRETNETAGGKVP